MSTTRSGTSPGISLGSMNRINLDGSNVGATCFIRRGISSDPPEGCCCINIYSNSNVQGSNSSLLLGSNIRIKNSGVHLYFRDLKLGEEPRSTSRRAAEFGTIVLLPLLLFLCLLSSLLMWW
ncbi:hypothetical protein J1N35_001222 [Gossypium stocksii]|uniref:Uncharacterized protein n=1 Tax=Gossypium stocksii TaxID=47602 RepID=A0A9D4ALX2_9ROSI|nr:hypothetical protein J1N35_001222 [Gossypium stocksii]